VSVLEGIVLALALVPLTLGLANFALIREPKIRTRTSTLVSVLIPARNEEANIEACLRAVLAQEGVKLEVLVMDDGSTDRTAAIVQAIAATDARVKLLTAPPLPQGWTGKVHACARLAEAATGQYLLFLDADVRVTPWCAAAMAGHAGRNRLGLVSAVPRQQIGSLGEAVTVPMINFLIWAYLPGGGRAFTTRPALAAACGQLLMAEAAAYRAAGGHAAHPGILHDALVLARHMRAQGHRTELLEGADLAVCRMYRSFAECWAGFSKNATEGMATPIALPIWTLVLGGAHVLPWLLLPGWAALLAVAISLGYRGAVTWRTREPWWTVPLHPVAVTVALAIQWTALVRARQGRSAGWKGRAYPAAGGA
jgi:hypothetical protein